MNTDALRPYRGFSSILQIDNAGSSIYHSLQVNLNRRLSHGLLFGVAYTWSKSLDFGSDQSYQLPDYYNPQANYGPSDFDIRNTLVVNYVWDIPYGNNFDNRFVKGTLGNWQLSGTTQAQSGEPFTVSTNDDFAGVGVGAGPQRWDMTGTPAKPHEFGGAGADGLLVPADGVCTAGGRHAGRPGHAQRDLRAGLSKLEHRSAEELPCDSGARQSRGDLPRGGVQLYQPSEPGHAG